MVDIVVKHRSLRQKHIFSKGHFFLDNLNEIIRIIKIKKI
jgi:hypothetical protein